MRDLSKVIFSLSIFVALTSCSSETADEKASKIRPAKLVQVQSNSNERVFDFPAVIRAAQTANLTFQVSGEIREVNVLEGAQVKKGDIIAQLDRRDALNALAKSEAEFENTKAEFDRAERLVAEGAISRSVLETRRTQRDIASASLKTAQKALSDMTLRAPFDGGISSVTGRQYQNIQAKEEIAILQSAEVEAVVNIPGTIIAYTPLLEPKAATVTLDVAPNIQIPADVKEASGIADEATQTYQIVMSFVPPEQFLILPGMTASVAIGFAIESTRFFTPNSVAVPLSSILAEGDDTYVWLVNTADMTLTKRKIQVQKNPDDMIAFTQGLSSGDTIVAAGVSFFHEGMKVRPWTPE